MIIEFERAFSPESMELQPCGICGVEFQSESVLAQVRTGPGGGDMGCACRVCVEYLGDRNPEQFQSIEEYEQALQRYPQPIWSTTNEAHLAERDLGMDEFLAATERASWWISTR